MGTKNGSKYFIYLVATKMYHDLQEVYWWNGMKKDFAEFIAKCPNCQQVRAEDRRAEGFWPNISIPSWMLE